MILQLNIENFKSWRSTGPLNLAPITVFFGPNSSGKTSLLQFLLMLKQTTDSPDRRLPLDLGDERSLVDLGSFSEILTREKTDEQPGSEQEGKASEERLGWTLSWRLPEEMFVEDIDSMQVEQMIVSDVNAAQLVAEGAKLTFSAKIAEMPEGRKMYVEEMKYGLGHLAFGMKRDYSNEHKEGYRLFAEPQNSFAFKRAKPGRVWPLPPPAKCYGFPDEVRAYYRNAGFLSDFELAFERLFQRVFYLGPLREYPKRQYNWAGADPADMGKRGEFVIRAILASKEKGDRYFFRRKNKKLDLEELIASWLKELGLIHSFKVRPVSRSKSNKIFQVWVRRSERSAEVLLTDVGFGISQILPVIALCYYVPKGSVVILEQPEIHLHPTVQAGLADVFIHAINARNIQIILESHSEYLLKRLQRRMAEEALNSSEAALYFCTTDVESGLSQIRALQTDAFGHIVNWPEGFFGDPFEEIYRQMKAEIQRKKKADIS